MSDQEIASLNRFNNPLIVRSFGVVIVAFFGACGAFGIKKFFETKPGLILNSDGVTDNSSGASVGFIPWTDVRSIDTYEIRKQKMISIAVFNPEKYIEACKPVRKVLMKANYKLTGNVINISANSLEISFTDLLTVCHDYFAKYGNNR